MEQILEVAPAQRYTGTRFAYRNALNFNELQKDTGITGEERYCFLCFPQRLNSLSPNEQEALRVAF